MKSLQYICCKLLNIVPGAQTFLIVNRFNLILLFLLCGLFLKVPAAATLQSLYVGAEAPDFSLKDFNEQSLAFEDFKGEKLTMIIFWSSWSRNSGKVLTAGQELYSKYKNEGLGVVAVNVDSQQITPAEITQIKAMVADLNLDYPVLLDRGLSVFHAFGVIAIPSTVIVDPERTIRYELSGYPLVGSEEMVDFTMAYIEGRAPKEAVKKKGYQPDKKALRFYNMGKNALHSQRMASTAEMWFKKATEADSRFVQPHISLGKFYAARDQISKAKEEYDSALMKEPENVIALCELALLLVEEDKTAESKLLIQKAIKAEEYYTPCYYYLGYIYGLEGNMEEALSMFEHALEINRIDMDIFIYKGRMYEETANASKAAEAYRHALELMINGERG